MKKRTLSTVVTGVALFLSVSQIDANAGGFTCNTVDSTDAVTFTKVEKVDLVRRVSIVCGLKENTTTGDCTGAWISDKLTVKGTTSAAQTASSLTDIYSEIASPENRTIEGSIDLCKKVSDRAKEMQAAGQPAVLVWNAKCKSGSSRTDLGGNPGKVIFPTVKSCTLNGEIPADLYAEAKAIFDAAHPPTPPSGGGTPPKKDDPNAKSEKKTGAAKTMTRPKGK